MGARIFLSHHLNMLRIPFPSTGKESFSHYRGGRRARRDALKDGLPLSSIHSTDKEEFSLLRSGKRAKQEVRKDGLLLTGKENFSLCRGGKRARRDALKDG